MSLETRQTLELGTRRFNWPEVMQEALTAPAHMGDTYNRFHSYSFGNQVLLMMQGVTVPVAGYRKWQQLNRYVKKGAQGKYILHPIMKKIVKDDGTERIGVVGFKLRKSVFAVTDTEGEELPPVEIPDFSTERMLGNLAIKQVPFESVNGNMQAYAVGKTVAVNPVAVEPFPSLIHEVAHVVAGHTEEPAEYQAHRGLFEFEAEATAYLVCNELDVPGWNRAESRGYIQGWLLGETPPDRNIKRVFSAATAILNAGRLVVEEAEDDDV